MVEHWTVVALVTLVSVPSTIVKVQTAAASNMTNNSSIDRFWNEPTNQMAIGAGGGGFILLIIIVVLACALYKAKRERSTDNVGAFIASESNGTLRLSKNSLTKLEEKGNIEAKTSLDLHSEKADPKATNAARKKSAAQSRYSDIDLPSDKKPETGVSKDEAISSDIVPEVEKPLKAKYCQQGGYSDIDLPFSSPSIDSSNSTKPAANPEPAEPVIPMEPVIEESQAENVEEEVQYAAIVKPVPMLDNDLYGT